YSRVVSQRRLWLLLRRWSLRDQEVAEQNLQVPQGAIQLPGDPRLRRRWPSRFQVVPRTNRLHAVWERPTAVRLLSDLFSAFSAACNATQAQRASPCTT